MLAKSIFNNFKITLSKNLSLIPCFNFCSKAKFREYKELARIREIFENRRKIEENPNYKPEDDVSKKIDISEGEKIPEQRKVEENLKIYNFYEILKLFRKISIPDEEKGMIIRFTLTIDPIKPDQKIKFDYYPENPILEPSDYYFALSSNKADLVTKYNCNFLNFDGKNVDESIFDENRGMKKQFYFSDKVWSSLKFETKRKIIQTDTLRVVNEKNFNLKKCLDVVSKRGIYADLSKKKSVSFPLGSDLNEFKNMIDNLDGFVRKIYENRPMSLNAKWLISKVTLKMQGSEIYRLNSANFYPNNNLYFTHEYDEFLQNLSNTDDSQVKEINIDTKL